MAGGLNNPGQPGTLSPNAGELALKPEDVRITGGARAREDADRRHRALSL